MGAEEGVTAARMGVLVAMGNVLAYHGAGVQQGCPGGPGFLRMLFCVNMS